MSGAWLAIGSLPTGPVATWSVSAPPAAIWLVVLAIAGGLLSSAFFSGCETGLMSVSRVRLRRTAAARTPLARRLLHLLAILDQAILTCLIGTNLSNVLISAVATAVLTVRFGARGEWLAMISV